MPASFLCGASAGLQKMCVPVNHPFILAFCSDHTAGGLPALYLFYNFVVCSSKRFGRKISKSAEGLTHSFGAQK